MSYMKYTHVERLGHPNVDGLLIGECYVFPKLDGTNGVLWSDRDQGGVCTGSRRRDLTVEGAGDNHGFRQAMWDLWNAGDLEWIQGTYDGVRFPIFYGEWLVPHTLKTYREDAWRRFYVFDARCPDTGRYLHYDTWAPQIREQGAHVLEPLAIVNNPTEDDIIRFRDTVNTYLIAENSGVGEGVVVKNYGFTNHVGKTVWGKSVRNDFKEDNKRAFGTPEHQGSFQVEAAIAEEFVTQAFVEKTRAKVENAILSDLGLGWDADNRPDSAYDHEHRRRFALEEHRGQLIPRLLQTVFHELLDEETANFVKKHKDPTIDFKKLRAFAVAQTKKFAGDLF